MTDRSLDETLENVWHLLMRGVTVRNSAARYMVLASVGAEAAEARMVVLRGADRATGTLEVHTDSTSAKVKELEANPFATILIWDGEAKLQIRLRVNVLVEIGDAAAWDLIPVHARDAYGGAPLPGDPLDRPTDFAPSADLNRFAKLSCQIDEIETLQLGTPHQRARFRDGVGSWIAP